jgi:hypothetical protein
MRKISAMPPQGAPADARVTGRLASMHGWASHAGLRFSRRPILRDVVAWR